MSDLYAEQLEMQLRFAEEESQEREMIAYEQGKADGIHKFVEWFKKSDYYLCYSDTIDDVLAKYEKEQKNEM